MLYLVMFYLNKDFRWTLLTFDMTVNIHLSMVIFSLFPQKKKRKKKSKTKKKTKQNNKKKKQKQKLYVKVHSSKLCFFQPKKY